MTDPLDHLLRHLDEHLDEELRLDDLAQLAGLSPFHLHRLFRARFGLTPAAYVQQRRLKRASYQLAFRAHRPVLDVALDAGYEGPEAFARAFKRKLGQTPSDFRRQPGWDTWHAAFTAAATAVRQRRSSPRLDPGTVRRMEVPATRVALLAHRGDPRRLGDTLRAFLAWRREHRLPPSRSATFNVLYEDPDTVPPEAFRLDLCAATDGPVGPNPQGVVAATLAGGRYAVLRHVGSDDTLGTTVRALYADWLPASGETLRDAPLVLQRVRFFPDVPEHAAETDVLLPLAPLP